MMRLRFGQPNTRLNEKYDGRDDPRDHLAKWTKAYGTKLQPEWVHLFSHTLDTIPMNWYFETELRHGTEDWDILREGFLLTFSFEDGFESIDEALQDIKAVIFRTPREPLEWVQPDWGTQLRHALECYNVMTEEEDEDPRNINILEVKGHRKVEGPQIDNSDITALLKTKQVNIGTEAELKFANIGDYWDDASVGTLLSYSANIKIYSLPSFRLEGHNRRLGCYENHSEARREAL